MIGINRLKVESLKNGVSSTFVLRELENAILSGYFKPRERLVERDLLVHFDVSRTVIREVLNKLEGKGLVKITPYRGAVVVDLTSDEIEQIYFLRAKLEVIAAGLVVMNITRQEVQQLDRLRKELQKHQRERTAQMIEKDNEFHRVMFQPSRNDYLNYMIDYLSTKAHVVKFNAWSLPNRIEQSMREHGEMIEALKARDGDAFEKLVIDHLLFSKKSYLERLGGRQRR
jgi:DNA-binding GntR family transcriptional regulator